MANKTYRYRVRFIEEVIYEGEFESDHPIDLQHEPDEDDPSDLGTDEWFEMFDAQNKDWPTKNLDHVKEREVLELELLGETTDA